MTHMRSGWQTRGESISLDDIPLLRGSLFGAVFGSPLAHGLVRRLDVSGPEQIPGGIRVFTFRDVTGENQIGGIVPEEPLFAGEHVHFCGRPLAFVVAVADTAARHAVGKITADIEPL